MYEKERPEFTAHVAIDGKLDVYRIDNGFRVWHSFNDKNDALENLVALNKSANSVSTVFKYLSTISLMTSIVDIINGVKNKDALIITKALGMLAVASGFRFLYKAHLEMADRALEEMKAVEQIQN